MAVSSISQIVELTQKRLVIFFGELRTVKYKLNKWEGVKRK